MDFVHGPQFFLHMQSITCTSVFIHQIRTYYAWQNGKSPWPCFKIHVL